MEKGGRDGDSEDPTSEDAMTFLFLTCWLVNGLRESCKDDELDYYFYLFVNLLSLFYLTSTLFID